MCVMMGREPPQLSRGKAFHRLIQQEWEQEAQGDITCERRVTKPGDRKGRVDIFVNDSDPGAPIAIVEIKATDWDRMKARNVRRNVQRQIRQIWSYIESQILDGHFVPEGEGKDVCPGIIFPRRPRDPKRLEQIEELFLAQGIQVVWHDESIEECRARNQA